MYLPNHEMHRLNSSPVGVVFEDGVFLGLSQRAGQYCESEACWWDYCPYKTRHVRVLSVCLFVCRCVYAVAQKREQVLVCHSR